MTTLSGIVGEPRNLNPQRVSLVRGAIMPPCWYSLGFRGKSPNPDRKGVPIEIPEGCFYGGIYRCFGDCRAAIDADDVAFADGPCYRFGTVAILRVVHNLRSSSRQPNPGRGQLGTGAVKYGNCSSCRTEGENGFPCSSRNVLRKQPILR